MSNPIEYRFPNKPYETFVMMQNMLGGSFHPYVSHMTRDGDDIVVSSPEGLPSEAYADLWNFVENYNEEEALMIEAVQDGIKDRMDHGSSIILMFRTLCVVRKMETAETMQALSQLAGAKELLELGLLESAIYAISFIPDEDSFFSSEYQPGITVKEAFLAAIQEGIKQEYPE